MNEVAFINKRRKDWQRLQMLVDKADISPTQLRSDELTELIQLYRQTSGDLALARTQTANLPLVESLNDLTARAYMVLYRPPRDRFLKAIRKTIVNYAQTARRCWGFILASFLVMITGALFGVIALSSVPETRDLLIPPGTEENFEQWKSGTFTERSFGEGLAATGFYMSNNPRVALINSALAAGTFGFGTAYILFQNGVLLGTITHETASVNQAGRLYTWIMPHGVTELQGAVISGASGFVMGWALIFPGRRSRYDSLRIAMKDALTLMIGGIVMMYLAAPFEGFFSFNPNVPDAAKWAVTGIVGFAWVAFYAGYGRETPVENTESVATGNLRG